MPCSIKTNKAFQSLRFTKSPLIHIHPGHATSPEPIMLPVLPWLVALGPLALAAIGLVPATAANRDPHRMARLGHAAALLALALALAAALCLSFAGTGRAVAGFGVVPFALHLDALSVTMLLLVSLVGTVVIRYSRNYLDGDPHQGRFIKWLCLALASVLCLILAGNLVPFIAAWIATSLCLNRLLLFHGDRPGARLAARKKFVASRLGDACLVAAAWTIQGGTGSLDHQAIFAAVEGIREAGTVPGWVHGASALLVAAALLKSAQFPLHGWLVEVMETPTPVSALLHAGIINAGGFLVLRFSGIIGLSSPALDVLALVGAVTALFGSVVMLTQTSVKAALAHSTIAQMGFMMLQCGLGAFSAALLHIVAHSLYKAHAFLSSGSVVDLARASWTPKPGGKPHPFRLAAALAAVSAMALAVGTALGASPVERPGTFALGAILLMGLVHYLASAIDERPSAYVIGRSASAACLVAVAYFALQHAAWLLTADALPVAPAARGPLDLAIAAAVVVAFGAVTILQSLLPAAAGSPALAALYVHVANGFYVNAVANRLVVRHWPGPSAFRAALARSTAPGTGSSP
jgi:NAD(P)H-quinone oxidoreductase subunit 5